MPAYSFQPQFVDPIRAGTKGGTIRAERRIPARWSTFARERHPGGHAAPGQTLHLFCRQRHRSGFAIGERPCIAAEPVYLDFVNDRVLLGPPPAPRQVINSYAGLGRFAVFDGFKTWANLTEFWHGVDSFAGWHIRWLPLRA